MLSGTNQTDFICFLQNELLRRCKTNPRYSLRAFSRTLQADPSFVSKLLHRKRNLTKDILVRFSERLNLDPMQQHSFLERMDKPRGQELSFTQLTMQQFQVISDWYHYAILELIRLSDFKGDPRWISRRLGISVHEVNMAVERLLVLGYLTISKRGVWKNVSGSHTTTHIRNSAVALRKYQNQVLNLASQAMENVPIELRDQSSMVLAINKRDLHRAKVLIKDFRRDFCTVLEKRKKVDDVYQLMISFFPITKQLHKGETK